MSTSKPEAESSQTPERSKPQRAPEVDKYIDVFLSAVCDTSRRYILELLAVPDEGIQIEARSDEPPTTPERRSGEIAKLIGLSAATTSEHLRQLSNAGLIASRREGNVVYYRLRNHKLVQAFQQLILALDSDYRERL